MPLFTSDYLKSLARNKTLTESTKMFAEKDKAHTSFDIFLSHSFLDKDEVEGLYLELTKMGFSVYVDWIVDPHLDRNNVTKATATLVKHRLKSSKSLLLAVSYNASMSKWMPWELGFVDGSTNNCAIVPVSREIITPKSYKGVEYLSLYPFIKKVPDSSNRQRLWVVEEAQKYVVLESWMNGAKPQNTTVDIFNL